MTEFREVTLEERQQMMADGVFDINGNLPTHPGYTGIHKHKDGSYWFRGERITDPRIIYAIEHKDDPKPIEHKAVMQSWPHQLFRAWRARER